MNCCWRYDGKIFLEGFSALTTLKMYQMNTCLDTFYNIFERLNSLTPYVLNCVRMCSSIRDV